ncbi:MAG: lipase family protein [Solirubrobacteraceae bacterium]|nr:lipase family protein [Solirubrobacteraceae bacterium]
MLIGDARGPGYADLWPGQTAVPVIPDLADRLLAPQDGPDPHIAYALATLATYAYSDLWTVAAAGARLGLPHNFCRRLDVEVDVLFVRSQAYLLQSADGRVGVLVYRGTTPTSGINWLADLEIDREQVKIDLNADGTPDPFFVHRGFYRNVRATGWKVVAALDRAVRGQSVARGETIAAGDGAAVPPGEFATGLDSLEALYITGHSLGGAMASLAGVLLHSIRRPDLARTIRGIYTYGAPMVGSPELAATADLPTMLGGKVFRYVYGDDIVPPVPPRASGDFQHFGTELHCKSGATEWAERRPTKQRAFLLPSVPSVGIDFLARQVLGKHLPLPFKLSIVDHLPANYLDALGAAIGVETEFGR